jgi:hypothetical protein
VRLARGEGDLPAILTELLGEVLVIRQPSPAGPGWGAHVLALPDPAGGTLEVRRLEPPFTPAEYARAYALVDLVAALRGRLARARSRH